MVQAVSGRCVVTAPVAGFLLGVSLVLLGAQPVVAVLIAGVIGGLLGAAVDWGRR